MDSLDAQIAKAHSAAEATEHQARQLEARILKTGAQLPKRQYGSPVSPEALKQNLTARALICKRDPELASYLGLQDGSYRRAEEEEQSRILQMQRMQLATEQARQRNEAAAAGRYRAQLAGINPLSNRRLGQ